MLTVNLAFMSGSSKQGNAFRACGFKVGHSQVPDNVEGPIRVAVVENPIERDSNVGGKHAN